MTHPSQGETLLLSHENGVSFYRNASYGAPAMLARTTPSANSVWVRSLEHDFEISRDFERDWALCASELRVDEAVTSLIFMDPGGMPLSACLGRIPQLSEFLTVSIGIADALEHLHARGLIHNALRPSSIWIGNAGSIQITDFGATVPEGEIGRQLSASEPAPGAWPYMSPEATGRMNRSVDMRSDLYGLGVVLYEFLSNSFPFAASNARQWIEAHTARQPLPPGAKLKALPAPIAEMLLRLLSKDPVERYQTASGLKYDLQRCLDLWQARGHIADIELGSRDISRKLYFSEKLYGRQAETGKLISVYEEVADRGALGVALVSGVSGIGKSAVVDELHKAIIGAGGLFARAKSDQSRLDVPYATLSAAFGTFFSNIVTNEYSSIETWRSRLHRSLGSNASLMLDLIPELTSFLDPALSSASLPAVEDRYRFYVTFKQFLKTLSTVGHPFTLFIDDMQWLDGATLQLLSDIVADADVGYFLLVGAYRSDEVNDEHPLKIAIGKAGPVGARFDRVELLPLRKDNTTEFLSDCLREKRENVADLAGVLHDVSEGNPFFVRQLALSLIDSGRISFDTEVGRWSWSLSAVRSAVAEQNLSGLLAARLALQDEEARNLIKLMSCVGHNSDVGTLSILSGHQADHIDRHLAAVVKTGLIRRSGQQYSFYHDKVQEAAYGLVSDDDKARSHFEIGTALAEALPPNERNQRIFEIVGHLNKGAGVDRDQTDGLFVAKMAVEAARKAKQSTAHASYNSYLRFGRAFLPADAWESQPDLAFEFEISLSESEFLVGDLGAAERRLERLHDRVRLLTENGAITWLQINLFTATGQLDRAVGECLRFLETVGIHWQAHPTEELIEREYAPILAEISSNLIGERIAAPALNDATQRIVMNVLAAVLPPAFFTDHDLARLVLCRMANISKTFGNDSASSLGYAYLGMVLGPSFGQWEAGYQFGELGFRLSGKHGPTSFKSRVQMTFSYHVMPYSLHVTQGRDLLRAAFDLANEDGDLTYAGYSSCTLISSLLFEGANLQKVQAEAEKKWEFVSKAKFKLVAEIIETQLRLMRSLSDPESAFPLFDTDTFAEASHEEFLRKSPDLAIAECWYWIRKAQIRVLGARYDEAIAASRCAERLIWTTGGHLELVEYYFYAGLAHAACHGNRDPVEGNGNIEELEKHFLRLKVLASQCPANFYGRATLLEGEMARISGKPFEALRLYEAAIEQSRMNGFPHVEALAHETAAKLCRASDLVSAATGHLASARSLYAECGAMAKVRLLDAPGSRRTTYAMKSKAYVDGSYVETYSNVILEISRAISDGVGPDDLVRTLLVSATRCSQADLVTLILPQGEDLRLAAVAAATGGGVDVVLRGAVLDERHAPLEIVRQAISRGATRLISDTTDVEHRGHEYFRESGSVAYMCMPLFKGRRLVGVLCIEHRSRNDAVTAELVEFLRFIALLVMVALENVSLEEKESLLKEVHHRVKNNLQLITSLLNLQAAKIADPVVAELFQDSKNRVRSMALVHENLYRSGNLASISMGTHIQSLCAQLVRAYAAHNRGIQLIVNVDDAQLDIDSAIPCGLLVNELLSNAIKHAFPDDRAGRIEVMFRHIGGDMFELSVEDDGVGIPTTVFAGNSLGLQLVADIAHQLRAVVTRESTIGTKFVIRFSPIGGAEQAT